VYLFLRYEHDKYGRLIFGENGNPIILPEYDENVDPENAKELKKNVSEESSLMVLSTAEKEVNENVDEEKTQDHKFLRETLRLKDIEPIQFLQDPLGNYYVDALSDKYPGNIFNSELFFVSFSLLRKPNL
jgi:hypothetical protein